MSKHKCTWIGCSNDARFKLLIKEKARKGYDQTVKLCPLHFRIFKKNRALGRAEAKKNPPIGLKRLMSVWLKAHGIAPTKELEFRGQGNNANK